MRMPFYPTTLSLYCTTFLLCPLALLAQVETTPMPLNLQWLAEAEDDCEDAQDALAYYQLLMRFDSDRDLQITLAEQLSGTQFLVNNADADGNSALSQSEYRTLREELAAPFVIDLFQHIDADGDLAIVETEMAVALAAPGCDDDDSDDEDDTGRMNSGWIGGEDVDDILTTLAVDGLGFFQADADASSAVTVQEFRVAVHSASALSTDLEFAGLDIDADQNLSSEELQQALAGLAREIDEIRLDD